MRRPTPRARASQKLPAWGHAPAGAFLDKSSTNLASIVGMFEIYGRPRLLKLPHWGSTNNLTAGFFQRVIAKHYVIAGDTRFGLPQPDVLAMIAASRGVEEFHFTFPWETRTKRSRRGFSKRSSRTGREEARRSCTSARWARSPHLIRPWPSAGTCDLLIMSNSSRSRSPGR